MKHQIKRLLLYYWIKIVRFTSVGEKIRYPKNINEKEKTSIKVFSKVLHNLDSELYYDYKRDECYIKLENENIYIFLERLNLSIINSIYGYDVTISDNTEKYLYEMFIRELTKRRHKFKTEVLSKVTGSLEKTLYKLNKN